MLNSLAKQRKRDIIIPCPNRDIFLLVNVRSLGKFINSHYMKLLSKSRKINYIK